MKGTEDANCIWDDFRDGIHRRSVSCGVVVLGRKHAISLLNGWVVQG